MNNETNNVKKYERRSHSPKIRNSKSFIKGDIIVERNFNVNDKFESTRKLYMTYLISTYALYLIIMSLRKGIKILNCLIKLDHLPLKIFVGYHSVKKKTGEILNALVIKEYT